MRIGKLRDRVTIERLVKSRGGDGSTQNDWQALHRCVPAGIEHLSVRDLIAAQQAQSSIVARITIRWLPGITADMRIRDEATGEIYTLSAPMPDSKSGREWLTLPVAQGLSDA